MPFPPNPSHYSDETPLNRQIMQEDYDANQERFREAPVVTVMCSRCQKWFPETKVIVEDIREDPEGRDNLTFTCPDCHTLQESLRRTSR